MPLAPADLTQIISGIIALGASGGEQLFLPKIHAILRDMRSHNELLGGLWFSITGSVCYSGEIEKAVRGLALQGVLEMRDGSVAVVRNALTLRKRLRWMLPARRYEKLLSASREFYRRLGS